MAARKKESRAPGRRALQKAATRAALVRSARNAFARDGYAGARISDIARAASASPATFYLHFPTKQDIALAIAQETTAEAEPHYRSLEDVAASADRAGVRAWLSAFVTTWEALAPLVRAIEEAANSIPELDQVRAKNVSFGVDALARGLERRRSMPAPEAELRARLAMCLLTGVFTEFHRGTLDSPSAAVDIMADQWIATFGGPAS